MSLHTITIADPHVWSYAHHNAARLNMSVDEYVNQLIIKDQKSPEEHIPPHVLARWKKEIAEFEEEDKKNPQPVFTSAKEMVDYLMHRS